MRFKTGDDVDSAQAMTIHHEFLRCQESFDEFQDHALTMIMMMQNNVEPGKQLAFRTYNCYSRFVHYLYEFLIGATQREIKNTKKINYEDAEKYITAYLQRILNRRRKAILNGTAPAWENHISYYPEQVPNGFAEEFRDFRNKISAHVSYKRASMNLSDFYDRNHKFLYMFYYDSLSFWGTREGEFPDLQKITDFSVMIGKIGVEKR